jgi:hypothetical protein
MRFIVTGKALLLCDPMATTLAVTINILKGLRVDALALEVHRLLMWMIGEVKATHLIIVVALCGSNGLHLTSSRCSSPKQCGILGAPRLCAWRWDVLVVEHSVTGAIILERRLATITRTPRCRFWGTVPELSNWRKVTKLSKRLFPSHELGCRLGAIYRDNATVRDFVRHFEKILYSIDSFYRSCIMHYTYCGRLPSGALRLHLLGSGEWS